MLVDLVDRPVDFVLNVSYAYYTPLILQLQNKGQHRYQVEKIKFLVHSFSTLSDTFETVAAPEVRMHVICEAPSQAQPSRTVVSIGSVTLFPTVVIPPVAVAPGIGTPLSRSVIVLFPAAVGASVTVPLIV